MSKSLKLLFPDEVQPNPNGMNPNQRSEDWFEGYNKCRADCLAALKGKVVVVEDLPSEEEMIKAIISGWEINLPNDYRLHLIAQAIMALI